MATSTKTVDSTKYYGMSTFAEAWIKGCLRYNGEEQDDPDDYDVDFSESTTTNVDYPSEENRLIDFEDFDLEEYDLQLSDDGTKSYDNTNNGDCVRYTDLERIIYTLPKDRIVVTVELYDSASLFEAGTDSDDVNLSLNCTLTFYSSAYNSAQGAYVDSASGAWSNASETNSDKTQSWGISDSGIPTSMTLTKSSDYAEEVTSTASNGMTTTFTCYRRKWTLNYAESNSQNTVAVMNYFDDDGCLYVYANNYLQVKLNGGGTFEDLDGSYLALNLSCSATYYDEDGNTKTLTKSLTKNVQLLDDGSITLNDNTTAYLCWMYKSGGTRYWLCAVDITGYISLT